MANFICEAHIWSCEDRLLQDNTTAIHKYYSKNYTSRNITCKPENKFRENLSLAIQGLDDLLYVSHVLKIQWVSRSLVELIFSNGSILSIVVNHFNGDVLHIHKDITFANQNKFISFTGACDVLLTETSLIVSYSDLNELNMVTFQNRFDPKQVESMVDIISTKDERPKINKIKIDKYHNSIKFSGPNGSSPKHLSFNCNKNLVLLWFSDFGASQNIFIFRGGINGLDLLTSTLISGTLRSVKFSALHGDVILSVKSSPGAVTISRSKCNKGQMIPAFSSDVPTKSQVILSDWSTNEKRIAMATEERELFIFCTSTGVTLSSKISITPFKISWMTNNCCIMLLGKLGEIQFYDSALNPLKSLVDGCLREAFYLSEAFTDFSSEVISMGTNMYFDRKSSELMEVNECLLISMKGLPLILVTLGLGGTHNSRGINAKTILNHHLCSGKIFEAHEFLQSLDLSSDTNNCMSCLTTFVNHLLRQSPSDDIINYIQSALRKCYASTDQSSRIVAMEQGGLVTNLARRYFKHLIRFKMFEKCYLIARDIQHKDLFMELYYAARDSGETSLADSSRRAAMNLEEEMIEYEFQPDDKDSVKSLNSLDSLYSSPHSSDVEDKSEEMLQVNNREIITQLMRDTEALTMTDLNDEFTQFFK